VHQNGAPVRNIVGEGNLAIIANFLLIYVYRMQAVLFEYLHDMGCTISLFGHFMGKYTHIMGEIGGFEGNIRDVCQLLLIFC